MEIICEILKAVSGIVESGILAWAMVNIVAIIAKTLLIANGDADAAELKDFCGFSFKWKNKNNTIL